MRSIVLSALFAAGISLAAIGAASAANMGSGLDTAAKTFSPAVEKVVLVCRRIEMCNHHREFSRRVCRFERVCRERW